MEKYTMFMDRKNQYIDSENYPKQSIVSMQSLSSYQQYFSQSKTNNFTICIKTNKQTTNQKKTSNSQSYLEKEEWNWRNQPT